MDAVVFTVVLFGLFSFFVFSVAAAVLYKTGEPITGVAGAAAALAPLCGPAARLRVYHWMDGGRYDYICWLRFLD